MSDLAHMTAAEQARLIRARKASCIEVVQAGLARIAALHSKLNAFITVTAEVALQAARKADAAVRRGGPLGPLHGVPVAYKDNFLTKGVLTTAGSRVLEDHVPDRDATVVRRMREAGAILIGKAQMYEFATTVPHVFGTVPNPWDLERSPGGSSNGSGSAVAAGMCPIAFGSDTGGSTRIPASFCGVVGLKPTYGRVSRVGLLASAYSLDHAAPLMGGVEDAALVLGAVAGRDPGDPSSMDARVPSYVRSLRRGVKGLRVGLPREWFFDRVDQEVKDAVMKAVTVLEELGAVSDQVSIPMAPLSLEIGAPINGAENAAIHEEHLQRCPEKLSPPLRRRVNANSLIPASIYMKAQRLRRELRTQFLSAFDSVDVIITPTTPIAAPLLRQREYAINGTPVSIMYAWVGFTQPFNVTGLPAISVPCGFTKGGLPIGLQIVGRPLDEATILRAAFAFEQATEWHKRRPAL